MKRSLTALACATLSMLASLAHADISIKDSWVRATVAGQKATGAFMQINSTEAVRLVGAASPAAKIVELHEMKMEGDRMMMSAIDGLDVMPGKATELKPGGYHIMLIDVVKPLAAGDKVPLTLVVENSDKKRSNIEVTAEVRAMGAAGGMKHMHH